MNAKEELMFKEMEPTDLAYSFFSSYVALQNPKFIFAKHNILLCNKLQAVERGDIKRLIICMPPRHGKTSLVSEYFPAWYLGRNPDHQIIFTTYSFDKASDSGRKVRNQLVEPIHNLVFPDCVASSDSKSANKLTTDQGGMMVSVGVGGAVIGRGAHLFIIDDPLKSRQDAESDGVRTKLHQWFQAVAYTRLMSTNAIIIVQTRWHFDDLVGFCTEELAHEAWDIVSLPAVCEDEKMDVIGRKDGEALWPGMFPKERLDEIRNTVGTREWASQYQQNPIAAGGNMVSLEMFGRYNFSIWRRFDKKIREGGKEDMPFGIKRIVCSWDTAYKEKEINDPTSCTVWGVSDNGYYLLWVTNKRLPYPALWKEFIRTYEKNLMYGIGPPTMLIEDKGSGTTLIQDAKAKTNIPVIPILPEGNKILRFENYTNVIEAGLVILPDYQGWLSKYELDLLRFPFGKEDDNVDSTSQFLKYVSKPRKVPTGKRFWK